MSPHTRLREHSLSPSSINRWINASNQINLRLRDQPTPEPYWRRQEQRKRRFAAVALFGMLLLVLYFWYRILS